MTRKRFKIYFFVLKILHDFRNFITKIQKIIKGIFVRKSIQELLKMFKTNYTIMYYKNNEAHKQALTPKSVEIRVRVDEGTTRTLRFDYNKFLKCFLLFMSKDTDYEEHYLFSFRINGNDIIDINFPSEYGPDGKLYNVLNFKHLKENGYISNVKTDKYLTLPKRKLTCPDFLHRKSSMDSSESSSAMRSILKRSSDNGLRGAICNNKKKVSFNLRLNHSYL
jgi:hypothetical protein